MLNYDRKNKLYRLHRAYDSVQRYWRNTKSSPTMGEEFKCERYSNADTAICEIMTNCLSALVDIAQQAEYERIGEIELQSLSDNGGETVNYVLPPTLKITDLPLYIQDWLEKKSQDNVQYCTGVCAIFNKDGNACDAWHTVCTGLQAQCNATASTPNSRPPVVGLEFSVGGGDKIYTNIKKNTCWTAEQILYAHRNCGFIHDTRLGFTNITYATGCCQYCKNTLRCNYRELCRCIESYNDSYRANYDPQNLAPGIWNPLKMQERLFYALSKRSMPQVNHKLGKPFIPPMIQWFMDNAAKLITDNCDNERRYQYDSYQQIYFTSEHILMDEDELSCAIYYPGSENSYNTLCSSCLSNWKYTRSILYDLITEWTLIWGSEVTMSLDNRYMFAKQLILQKLSIIKMYCSH
jgi:hypothetical protein